MEWSARIFVKVVRKDVFERLYSVSAFGESGKQIFGGCSSEYVIDGDWSMTESELFSFAADIAQYLGEDGIVIADCTSDSVDPFTYCVFYLGDGIRTECFESCGSRHGREFSSMFDKTDIKKPHKWLTYAHFSVSQQEIKVLGKLGIRVYKSDKGNVFEYLPANLGLPGEIALTGTQYNGRAERIEKVNVGDAVFLVREPDSERGRNTIDIRTEEGSIGYLDKFACDRLSPLIDTGRIKYTAAVARVVPLSKRARHCKTAIVTVCVKVSFL